MMPRCLTFASPMSTAVLSCALYVFGSTRAMLPEALVVFCIVEAWWGPLRGISERGSDTTAAHAEMTHDSCDFNIDFLRQAVGFDMVRMELVRRKGSRRVR